MATLEDCFLAELDELSDNEVGLDETNDGDIDMNTADLETLDYDDLDRVSKLHKTQRYTDIIQKVEEALGKEYSDEDDIENKLIMDCSQLMVDIENEIVTVYNFIRDKYRLKFQELESILVDHHPVEYARVVKRIGNETDLALIDFEGLLLVQPAAIMVISLTMQGNALPEDALRKTLDACDRVIDLDSSRKKILGFVESNMGSIAPNLSAIVGKAVAAKIMGIAGGLSALANMPSCNVQVLGQKRKSFAGLSSVASQSRIGYLDQTKIFQKTPPGLRKRVSRLLASKSILATRVDATRGDPSGTHGEAFKEEIYKKIAKWQEPFPARNPYSIPVPDLEQKNRRGGRRSRKMKEKYAMTKMRELSNKMAFGIPEESSLGYGYGVGYGMLGQVGSKRLRVSSVPSKLKLSAKVAKKLKQRQYAGCATSTSGLMSSQLAFNSVKGMELCNPQALRSNSGTQSTYFSESGTFSKLMKI